MKTLLKRKPLIVIAIFALFLFFVFYFIFNNSTYNSSASFVENASALGGLTQIDPGLPARLKIPKINVNSVFEYVGLTKDGAMDVPKGPAEVGWFKLGTRPGEVGSAVVAGHSGWKNGPAVFDSLYKLQKGDKIYVTDNAGVITTFVVREIQKYKPKAEALNVFGSNDDKSHLNLITCTGFWNRILKSHSDRLVVFADKVIE